MGVSMEKIFYLEVKRKEVKQSAALVDAFMMSGKNGRPLQRKFVEKMKKFAKHMVNGKSENVIKFDEHRFSTNEFDNQLNKALVHDLK